MANRNLEKAFGACVNIDDAVSYRGIHDVRSMTLSTRRAQFFGWLRGLFVGTAGEGTLAGYLLLAVLSGAVVFGFLPRDRIVKLARQDNLAMTAALFRGHYAGATPVTLIDIDDRAYRSWGEPATTPYERLFPIIEKVLKLHPAAIVVDIDLSSPERPQRAALLDHMRKIAWDAAGDDQATPVLLVRKLRSDPARGKGSSVILAGADKEVDALVAEAPNMAWVSAFIIPGSRGMLEEWAAFSPICTESPPRALPSVALAAHVALKAPGQLEMLDADLAIDSSRQCFGSSSPRETGRKLPGVKIPLGLSAISYFFGWPLENTAILPTTDTAKGRRPLVMKMSAADVELADPSADMAIGRVVVIGASHADSKDFHQTPLGVMPGAYVLANMVVGANDVFGSTLAPRSRSALFALVVFAPLAAMATFLRGLLISIGVVVLGIVFLFGGLMFGLSALTIQDGLLLGFAMFGLYALLLQGYTLLQNRLIGRRKPLKEVFLSEYALAKLRKGQ